MISFGSIQQQSARVSRHPVYISVVKRYLEAYALAVALVCIVALALVH
ncbi:MAG: hypothetical protein ACRDFX_02740 [Chloroflexota bacterium]